MKRFIAALLFTLCVCAAAEAQRFQAGIRVGASLTDYAVRDAKFSAGTVVGGRTHAGFETALLARLAFTRHLHLQTEFEFNRAGYEFCLMSGDVSRRNIRIFANRIEIPLLLGVNAGPVHLFCGAAFRVSHNEKSSAPQLLKVKFNDSDTALTGGIGLNVHRFFIDARLTGYPHASVHNIMTVAGQKRSVTVTHQLRWSLSAGFVF